MGILRIRALVAGALRRREGRAVEGALPDALERIAGDLRAGAAPLAALEDAAVCGGPLGRDLAAVAARAREVGLGDALTVWAAERPLAAVAAAAAALEVTASAGGGAAMALEGLASGLRDRRDAADEVAALSAQARLSAVVVGGAPVASLALSVVADRRVAVTLAGTAAGRSCLLAGVVLELAAGLWMRAILRCRVVRGPARPGRRQEQPVGATGNRVRRRSWLARTAGNRVRCRSWLARTADDEQHLTDDDLALTADLLAASVQAGLTPYLALGVGARSTPPPVAARLGAVLGAVEAGDRLADALDRLGPSWPGLAPLLALLAASERSGSAVGVPLSRLAAGARGRARRRALARARKVPVLLLFPLVCLVLPSFVLLTVAPVVLVAISR